jgi:hypothetical protein
VQIVNANDVPPNKHRGQIAEAEQAAFNMVRELCLDPELGEPWRIEFRDDADADGLKRQVLG